MKDLNSDQLYQAIEQIAKTASKNEKEGLVKRFGTSGEFQRVLIAALNPFVTYGLAKLPERVCDGVGHFDSGGDTWALLGKLANRELTGNAAREAVQNELNRLATNSAELFARIIKKDLRAGFSESTVNKAIKGLIPEFPYMRCSLPKHIDMENDLNWRDGVLSQEKADGMFTNVNHEGSGVVEMLTRQGNPFPMEHFGELEKGIKTLLKPNTQSHGEVVVFTNGVSLSRELSNGVMNRVLSGGAFEAGEVPMLFLWDQIPLKAVVRKGKYNVGYKNRFGDLVKQVHQLGGSNVNTIPTIVVHSIAEAYKHYSAMLVAGKEGTVIKCPDATWKDGTSKQQIKLKLEAACELKVVGFEAGNGKNATTFGSMICRTEDDLLEVGVSGISDTLRAEIHGAREDWTGSIITVLSNSIMEPSKEGKLHSLFLPRYIERRKDKTQADTLARVREQFDNAIKAVAA